MLGGMTLNDSYAGDGLLLTTPFAEGVASNRLPLLQCFRAPLDRVLESITGPRVTWTVSPGWPGRIVRYSFLPGSRPSPRLLRRVLAFVDKDHTQVDGGGECVRLVRGIINLFGNLRCSRLDL